MSAKVVVISTVSQADATLQRLIEATIRQESLIAARDGEFAAIEARYAGDLEAASEQIAAMEVLLEGYYRANRPLIEQSGRKSLQLKHGLVGIRGAGSPALAPLNERWPWEKIERKIRRLFKGRFFHPPKPRAIDKVKLKRELSAEQLEQCGLKLEAAETFYVELDRAA